MRKHVLIPTDFSSSAFNAVQYAFELFKNRECTFHIYHAYYIVASSKGNPLFPVPDELEYRTIRQSKNREMDILKENINRLSNNEKHQITYDFEYGFLTDLLKEKVESDSIDMIVMGTRGVTNNKDVAYGRNAINVMEKVRSCPVLAIPRNIKFEALNEIVFPTDFEAKFNLDEMETLRRIAETANASIQFLHIGSENNLDETQQKNKQFLEDYFKSVEFSFHWLQDVALMEGLLLFVKQRKSSMISFVNRKHWFFGTIFTNPLIKNLGVHATVPLLALHGQ
ncbi:universal stress protein [Aequorivita viscosa]|uniref:Nucleotide-binding universal stress protein, UspA family n=1 Tax=Aequorivita viscosa TaxID=797419 RepID=A0A1M6FEN2_9FLAO|nr:universal stress protein [Aequorivita viscosa]SDW68031.1 Nucleotide-binding universal stress protein, UspA family [Aequorivita viscosa]SHI96188.1 Nucleotide-binding universal stress protein, UspA family [Aequorivita viscosa]